MKSHWDGAQPARLDDFAFLHWVAALQPMGRFGLFGECAGVEHGTGRQFLDARFQLGLFGQQFLQFPS